MCNLDPRHYKLVQGFNLQQVEIELKLRKESHLKFFFYVI